MHIDSPSCWCRAKTSHYDIYEDTTQKKRKAEAEKRKKRKKGWGVGVGIKGKKEEKKEKSGEEEERKIKIWTKITRRRWPTTTGQVWRGGVGVGGQPLLHHKHF